MEIILCEECCDKNMVELEAPLILISPVTAIILIGSAVTDDVKKV